MNNVINSSELQHGSSELLDADVFISDLHLCASRPEITQTFLRFLNTLQSRVHGLYILGDLFEYWAGDDDIHQAHHQNIISALRLLAESGVNTYFMHGNRDFLVSEAFCKATMMTLLRDPTLMTLHGKRILLSHGDELCTDDVAYQNFRLQVRSKAWQTAFLSLPLSVRKQQIESIRMRSEADKTQKSAEIMDVNDEGVAALLKVHHYPELFIHGHTHRPKQHHLMVDGHSITRWVLGDWYEQGSYLVCNSLGVSSGQLLN